MVPARLLSSLLALAVAGCGLVAREHACWPFLAHQYNGHVPSEAVHLLAHEHGTRKTVGAYRAPSGYYWRRRGAGTLDLQDVRTVMGKYELARCPYTISSAARPPATPPTR
jgi:hypothetical protein